jgi:hypothetical protein
MSPIETEPGPDISPESNEGVAIRRFIQLTREERELKARLQQVASMKGALELSIRDYLMSSGLDSVHADGFIVYIREQLWAKAKATSTGPEVCAALKAAGMGQFVREHFEVQALSAHIRGLKHAYERQLASGAIKDISEVLPPEVARVLNVNPTYSVIAAHGRE